MPPSETIAHWVDPVLKARGIPHGVTLAAQGDMKDEAARRAALAAAGLSSRVPVYLKQVHGTAILPAPAAAPSPAPEGDGWVTDGPSAALCVFVADCMPLFAADRSGRAVGLFHSGWRGTAAGLPGLVLAAFKERFGTSDLYVSVGPHIRSCCYKVGPEFEKSFRPGSLARREGGLYLDLAAEARAQLVLAGLPSSSVSTESPCTSCGSGFFSYRRDKQANRMMGFIALGSHV